ncbi:MAG: hypothetical protein ACOYMG_04165, partial [Candidatus Methylumidiphilus sp.]
TGPTGATGASVQGIAFSSKGAANNLGIPSPVFLSPLGAVAGTLDEQSAQMLVPGNCSVNNLIVSASVAGTLGPYVNKTITLMKNGVDAIPSLTCTIKLANSPGAGPHGTDGCTPAPINPAVDFIAGDFLNWKTEGVNGTSVNINIATTCNTK